jgi:hypothetical protein
LALSFRGHRSNRVRLNTAEGTFARSGGHDVRAGAPEMARLELYVERVTGSPRDHRSRSSFAVYAFGLLTEGERVLRAAGRGLYDDELLRGAEGHGSE